MTKQHPTLGPGVSIDVDRLLVSRLLIQANSGGGKSWTIRRLLEQTHGRCQQILIDVEGEFHTLREQFDYVLAGKGGDCPADLRSAELLARRLLELNVSAIVDIYELGAQRGAFVARFLGALMAAPRELWHPALVVVDEAHLFCPEKGRGEAESTAAVIDLMTRGRKRGFCGVLATQRISKLNKDAAAEANNKLIGRSALDVDMKRAAEELGLTGRDEMMVLRKLMAGEFFAYGPAIGTEVVRFQVGAVQTSHPEAGEKAPPPTPPRERIRKVLSELADLPAEAEAEAKTAAELRAKVRELEAEVRAAKKANPAPKAETKTVERAVIKDGQLVRIEKLIERGEQIATIVEDAGRKACLAMETAKGKGFEVADAIAAEMKQLRAAIASTKAPTPPALMMTAVRGNPPTVTRVAVTRPALAMTPALTAASTNVPKGEAAILTAVIQHENGCTRQQLTTLTSYKRSTRDAYIQRLREKGFVEERGDRICATADGTAAMPNVRPLPTGAELRAWWLARLPAGERAVLEQLLGGEPVDRDTITEKTGYQRSTRDAYLQRLRARELVVDLSRGMVMASPTLFEVA